MWVRLCFSTDALHVVKCLHRSFSKWNIFGLCTFINLFHCDLSRFIFKRSFSLREGINLQSTYLNLLMFSSFLLCLSDFVVAVIFLSYLLCTNNPELSSNSGRSTEESHRRRC
ncbi:hypothetical protein CEXT_128881 [Caerostris extrusa]|uniref:Uncharacterized protein n=1 Tax=Caerostris extrusa TaxID=172846 RepID=A0AAV4T7F2_CAEEX|nr:hypothetical protein CEXT_128881 [Caerostris extrusa]